MICRYICRLLSLALLGGREKSGNDGKPSNSKKTIRKNKMESWKWCKNSNDRKAAK